MVTVSRDVIDGNAAEAILKNLSSRANVESTLILSRKDGSIIRSSGFREAQPVPAPSQSEHPENANEAKANGDKEDAAVNADTNESSGQHRVLSPAEHLASAIYAFVKAADGLTSVISLEGSSTEVFGSSGASENSKRQSNADRHHAADAENDTDVQLLRMRTRRQEVIIFPDANFLCCVVQNLSRASNSEVNK